MKKTILIAAIVLIANLSSHVYGQVNLRHVTGLKYLGLSVSYVPDGLNMGVYHGLFLKRNMGLEFAGFVEKGDANLGSYSLYYFQPEYFYTLGNVDQWMFFNLKLALSGGYETLDNKILAISSEKFIYGVVPGFRTEVYLANNLKLDLNFEIRYMPPRQTGSLDVKVGLGMAYNF